MESKFRHNCTDAVLTLHQNLQLLKLVHPGETICLTSRTIIVHRSWQTSIWRRCYTGESRHSILTWVENLITTLCDPRYLPDLSPTDLTDIVLGLSHLSSTYSDDTHMVSTLTNLISNLTRSRIETETETIPIETERSTSSIEILVELEPETIPIEIEKPISSIEISSPIEVSLEIEIETPIEPEIEEPVLIKIEPEIIQAPTTTAKIITTPTLTPIRKPNRLTQHEKKSISPHIGTIWSHVVNPTLSSVLSSFPIWLRGSRPHQHDPPRRSERYMRDRIYQRKPDIPT
jgi:hypothetical protein